MSTPKTPLWKWLALGAAGLWVAAMLPFCCWCGYMGLVGVLAVKAAPDNRQELRKAIEAGEQQRLEREKEQQEEREAEQRLREEARQHEQKAMQELFKLTIKPKAP